MGLMLGRRGQSTPPDGISSVCSLSTLCSIGQGHHAANTAPSISCRDEVGDACRSVAGAVWLVLTLAPTIQTLETTRFTA